MINGSCLCGAVSFTIDGSINSARFCHCGKCRKFSGSSAGVWASAERSQLSVSTQESSVSKFDSGAGLRCFCRHCGSPVWFESKDYADLVMIPLGALDSGEVSAPDMRIFMASKATWDHPDEELVWHDTVP